MGRVVWSDQALDNVEEITAYVRDFSPVAAARLELSIVETAERLSIMPDRGRSAERGRRELTIVPPYIIQYVVISDEVRILSVRHSARRSGT
jgi:addiction module RelE/StbE family toxin